MFATAVIVFREILEAALIVGIVAAATRTIRHRTRWLAAGIVAGLIGAGSVALGTERIAELASGVGQELFNAMVLGLAVLMLAWHNLWMSSHGAVLAADARSVGSAIRDGRRECSVLMIVVGLAVLREGAETVLFLYGIAASEGGASWPMLTGGLAGIAAGIAVGYTVYAGLLRIPLRWFFTATGVLVLFLAAGMASQAARFLIQADILPSLADPLWDTSALLPQTSLVGTLLRSLVGYEERPAGMQIVFYALVLVGLGAGMKWVNNNGPRSTSTEQALEVPHPRRIHFHGWQR
jgi:high-affinity iron transporter